MKIYNKPGTKERMLEMMERVTKVKLNEFHDTFNGNNLGSNFGEEKPPEEPKEYSSRFQDLDVDEDAIKAIDDIKSEEEPEQSDDERSKEMGKGYGIGSGDNESWKQMDGMFMNGGKQGSETPDSETDDFDMSGENTQEPEQSQGDTLQGGIADNVDNTDFNGEQVRKGLMVEMEHTDDPMVALDIVYDHLSEDPMYYGDESQDPEQSAECGAQSDAAPIHGQDPNMSGIGGMMNNEPDDEETDILLGFKPLNIGDQLGDETDSDEIEINSDEPQEEAPIKQPQQESTDDYFSDEEKTMYITPITTKRDRMGFRYYKTNDNPNEVWGEKNGAIFNTNEYGEPTTPLRMNQVKVNGILPDNDIEGINNERKELGTIRRNMGLAETSPEIDEYFGEKAISGASSGGQNMGRF